MKLLSDSYYKSMREQTKEKLKPMRDAICDHFKKKAAELPQEEHQLTFNDYQKECRKTDIGTSAQDCIYPGWLYYVLGIAGESGEFAEKIKKLFRDNKGVIDDDFKAKVIKECGDILWYMARILDQFDITFNEVAEENITKLRGRLERNTIHGEGDER